MRRLVRLTAKNSYIARWRLILHNNNNNNNNNDNNNNNIYFSNNNNNNNNNIYFKLTLVILQLHIHE